MRWMPRLALTLLSMRARAHSHRLVVSWGCTELRARLFASHGNRVVRGHFAGLVLTPQALREHVVPHWLGCYEQELSQVWEDVFQGEYSQIVNVGAKFGFYCVGLARHFPQTPVLAFDSDPWARQAVREMANANGVNLGIKGICSRKWLEQQLIGGALIVSDCEGGEMELFGRPPCAALDSATLIIEVHELLAPGVTAAIRTAHAKTHEIRVLPGRSGTIGPQDFPELAELRPDEQAMAVNEYRGGEAAWLYLRPKQ